MVPMDQPKNALDMLRGFLRNQLKKTSSLRIKKRRFIFSTNINALLSFLFFKKELFSDAGESLDENNDLEFWRNKFESEEDIDNFDESSQVNQQPEKKAEIAISGESENFQEEVVVDQPPSKYELYQKQFYQFLNLAETSVQVLADRDGCKVYQSII